MSKKKKSPRNVFLGCREGDGVPCNRIRGVIDSIQSNGRQKEQEANLYPPTPADSSKQDHGGKSRDTFLINSNSFIDKFTADFKEKYITAYGDFNSFAYAENYVDKWMKSILKRIKRELSWNTGSLCEFSLTNDQISSLNLVDAKNIEEFLSNINRGRYLWFGFTYTLEYILDGKNVLFHKSGFSTDNYPKRFYWYVRNAIFIGDKEHLKYKTPSPSGNDKKMTYYIRECLEEIAANAGSSFKDYFSYDNGDFNFKKAYHKVEKFFRFVPIEVFWADTLMRDSEESLIIEGWEKGNSLNWSVGKTGNGTIIDVLYWILIYIGVGNNYIQIANELIANNNVHKNPNILRRKIANLINLIFGDSENVQQEITDRIICHLKESFSPKEIWKAYKNYYTMTNKKNKIKID